MIPVTPIEITPGITGSWVDVDVTAYVGSDAGSVALVILEIVNTSATDYAWGVRCNGSADTLTGDIEKNNHTWAAVGVDSNDIFECYLEDNTNVDIYLVAYATTAEAGKTVNAIDKSLGSTASWTDIDISGDTGADTAKVAFLLVSNSGGGAYYGFRENGSSDDRSRDIQWANLRGAMISLDGNEICEGIIESTGVDFYLTGWLNDNVTSWANAKDYSAGTAGSYQEVDFSGDIPSGNDGAFVHFYPVIDAIYDGHIRQYGGSHDTYYNIIYHQYLWVATDSNRKAEQKIGSTNLDLYLWGYTKQPVSIIEKSSSDSGNSVEATISLLAEVLNADTGSGTELSYLEEIGAVDKHGQDTAAGIDNAANSALIGAIETGSGDEFVNQIEMTVSESGHGIDIAEKAVAWIVTDSGSGVDSAKTTIALIISDSGYGIDIAGTAVALIVTDSGSGIGSAAAVVVWTGSDSGSGIEESVVSPLFFAGDSVLGLEAGVLFKDARVSDIGSLKDTLKALVSAAGASPDMRLPGRTGKTGIPTKGVNI